MSAQCLQEEQTHPPEVQGLLRAEAGHLYPTLTPRTPLAKQVKCSSPNAHSPLSKPLVLGKPSPLHLQKPLRTPKHHHHPEAFLRQPPALTPAGSHPSLPALLAGCPHSDCMLVVWGPLILLPVCSQCLSHPCAPSTWRRAGPRDFLGLRGSSYPPNGFPAKGRRGWAWSQLP